MQARSTKILQEAYEQVNQERVVAPRGGMHKMAADSRELTSQEKQYLLDIFAFVEEHGMDDGVLLHNIISKLGLGAMHGITKPVMNEKRGEGEDDNDSNPIALHLAKSGIWSVVNAHLRGNLTFIGKDDKVYTLAMVDKLLQSATNKKQLEHVFGLLDMERYMGGDAPAPFDPSNNE